MSYLIEIRGKTKANFEKNQSHQIELLPKD